MRRFFVRPEALADGFATITGDLFHHIVQVLRLKSGSRLMIADGEGNEFMGVIDTIGKESVVVAIEGSTVLPVAAGPGITLYQGLPKGDKLELILQKTTELGVSRIVPFAAERSIARISKGTDGEKMGRWQRIVREAARQSGCRSIPDLFLAGTLKDVVKESQHAVKLLLWEEEKENRLRDVLAKLPAPETVALIVGPEGGLTSAEAALATENGFVPVSLGQRILRTETAGLAMIAILQFYWGDLG